jgi:hypothetical protein
MDVTLTEKELNTAISSLLFSCSVNIISNTDFEFQNELFNLAKTLKQYKPDIALENVQFIQEEDYEDSISKELYEHFKDNISVTSFDHV